MSDRERKHGGGAWMPGAVRAAVAAVLGGVLLAGCASVHSAQEKVGGWFEGKGGETEAQSPPPAAATAKKPAKKPAVSAAPAATAPDATSESVERETPAAGESPAPDPEPQEPEPSVFDPY